MHVVGRVRALDMDKMVIAEIAMIGLAVVCASMVVWLIFGA